MQHTYLQITALLLGLARLLIVALQPPLFFFVVFVVRTMVSLSLLYAFPCCSDEEALFCSGFAALYYLAGCSL
jgi:hypothetical protein